MSELQVPLCLVRCVVEHRRPRPEYENIYQMPFDSQELILGKPDRHNRRAFVRDNPVTTA